MRFVEFETTLTSTAEDGLYEILLHGARVSSEATKGAVGLLELELEGDERALSVSIEAEFAYQDGRRVIDELEVRVRRSVKPDWNDTAMLRDGLAKFGGTAFTNLNVCSESGVDELDVSISFGSVVPVLAENTLLPLDGVSSEDAALYASLLSDLGVSHRVRSGTLHASRKQVRSRISVEQQVAAFIHAREKGRTVSLYACVLPAKQAVRFSESTTRHGKERHVDVVLSRGLSGGHVCSSEDARQMQAFVEHHLGVSFAGGTWSVRNVVGQGRRDAEPVFGGRNRGARGVGRRSR